MNKLVSICMATYNGEKYLKEQLDSIVSQTYANIEVIAQDDCSSDNTVSILNSYKDKLNITIYQNEKNLGYNKNFESVMLKSNGDFIAFCDQDDIWSNDKIEILLNNIGEKTLIYSNSLLVDSNNKTLNKNLSDSLNNNFISTKNPLTFINDNCVSAHAMLLKKELLEYIFPFPENVYFDAWVAANAASLNGIQYFDQCLVRYRQHETNTLSSEKKISKKKVKVYSKAQKKLNNIESKIKVIDTFLKLQLLTREDEKFLNELKKEYIKFKTSWFNKNLYALLDSNEDKLYEITTKSLFRLALKDAIGYKSYKWFPFL